MAPLVVTPEHAQAVGHNSGRAVRHAHVVEAPAFEAPAGEVDVGAGEGRAAEGGGHGHLVRGVVDGGEAVDEVAHLLRAVDQAAAFHPVRDSPVGERALQRRQYRARGDEDGDVAERGGPHAAVPFGDLPALGDDLGAAFGDLGRLTGAELRRLHRELAAEAGHYGPAEAARTHGVNRPVWGLHRRIGAVADQPFEHPVHPVDDAAHAPPVVLQLRELCALRREEVAGAGVDSHVGAAEAVNRLLRVADQE